MNKKITLTAVLNGRIIEQASCTVDPLDVGRAADNDLVLDNPGVSRVHFRVRPTDSDYRLEDAGSSNGTTLNGETVSTAVLRDGDVIGVGKFSVQVSIADASAPWQIDPTIRA